MTIRLEPRLVSPRWLSPLVTLGAIASVAVVLGAIYLLWSYQRMAYGAVREEHRSLPDLSMREVAVLAPILALLLVFGVYPRILTDRIDPTTQAVVQHVQPDHTIDVAPRYGPAPIQVAAP